MPARARFFPSTSDMLLLKLWWGQTTGVWPKFKTNREVARAQCWIRLYPENQTFVLDLSHVKNLNTYVYFFE